MIRDESGALIGREARQDSACEDSAPSNARSLPGVASPGLGAARRDTLPRLSQPL